MTALTVAGVLADLDVKDQQLVLAFVDVCNLAVSDELAVIADAVALARAVPPSVLIHLVVAATDFAADQTADTAAALYAAARAVPEWWSDVLPSMSCAPTPDPADDRTATVLPFTGGPR